MANDLYDSARDKYGSAQLSWPVDAYRCVAVDATYVCRLDSHTSLADIPASSRVVTSNLVANKSIQRGYFRASPTSFPVFDDPRQIVGIVLFKDAVLETDAWLVAWIDEAAGLPFTEDNREYFVLWQVANQGVLRL